MRQTQRYHVRSHRVVQPAGKEPYVEDHRATGDHTEDTATVLAAVMAALCSSGGHTYRVERSG